MPEPKWKDEDGAEELMLFHPWGGKQPHKSLWDTEASYLQYITSWKELVSLDGR